MRIAGAIACLIALSSCQREDRKLRPQPVQAALFGNAATESPIEPGGKHPPTTVNTPYEENAYAISEGQRLYEWYNCSGCHAHGGGGIGPPLIKHEWIYGGEPANLFDTIVKGRPNGMPTWGAKIPEYQIWELVAYVRSMNQLEPTSATPARPDEIQINPTIQNRRNGVTK
jgi:cytochrome c oxidase cbb3-type subunit III